MAVEISPPEPDNVESEVLRAFEIIDELNRISGSLRNYTLSIREIDYTTLGDPCPTNGFSLSISKHIARPK